MLPTEQVMISKVGSKGESIFSALCADAGLTVNPSIQDETGWDYFVEFPVTYSKPIDQTTAPISCLVQVKSTDKENKRSEPITLSNLIKLIHHPNPVFFCFIDFQGQTFPECIYLVHFGEEIIERVLKRLRELSNSKNVKLNERTLSISFNKSQRLKPLTGEILKRVIENYVPYGIEEYRRKKQEFIETIGYKEGNAIIEFDTHRDNIAERFIDFILGIKPFEVRNFKLFNSRFGIADTAPQIHAGSGQLFFEPNPTGKALVKISENSFGPKIIFECDWYATKANAILPLRLQKARLVNRLFEIIFSNGAMQFDFFKNYDGEAIKLSDLNKLANFFELIENTDDQLQISITFTNNDIASAHGDNLPSLSTSVIEKKGFSGSNNFIKLVRNAFAIARLYSIEGEIELTLDQLNTYHQSILIFNDIVIDNNKKLYKITGKLIDYEYSYLKSNNKVAGIFSVTTKIGNYYLACILAIINDNINISDEGDLEILSYGTSYHHFLMFDEYNKPNDEETDKEFGKVMAKIKDDGILPIRIYQTNK